MLNRSVNDWAAEWVEEGREQGLKQGLERGLEQGLERGLEHERALLRRQAAARFGAATAERLSEALAGIADPDRLAEIGEWIIECEDGGALLDRVERLGGVPAPGDGSSPGDAPSRG